VNTLGRRKRPFRLAGEGSPDIVRCGRFGRLSTLRAMAFLCLVLVVMVGFAPAMAQADELEEVKKELKRLQERLEKLEKERAKEIKAAKEAQAAPARELDPETVKKAIRKIAADKKAEEIEAGKRAAAKPRKDRTDEDLSAMSRQSILEKGVLPGYRTIPGTNTQIKFGGYARVDTAYDVKKIDGDDAVGSFASYILVDGERGHGDSGNFNIDPSATRFNFDMQTPTPGFGQFNNFDVFFEGDFWPELSRMRIRHAYGEWGPLLVGQTWPMFMDVAAQTPTFDYAGAVASTPIREPEIRWDQPFGDNFKLGLNATDPDGQLSIPSVGGEDVADVKNPLPDFALRALYTKPWGHLQLSGMARRLEVDDARGDFSDDSAFGWGALFSGKFTTLGKDQLGFGLTYGDGMARWRTALDGNSQDALLKTSGLKTVEDYGGWINYTHFWDRRSKWSSSVAYSHVEADNPSGSPDDFIERANYALGNLIWRPTPVLDTGLELTYVGRENENGDDGSLFRIKWGIQFKFHTEKPQTNAYDRVDYLFGGG